MFTSNNTIKRTTTSTVVCNGVRYGVKGGIKMTYVCEE